MSIQTEEIKDLIDRAEAVRIFEEMITSRSGKNCTNRQKVIEAAAFKYALEVIKRIPKAI